MNLIHLTLGWLAGIAVAGSTDVSPQWLMLAAVVALSAVPIDRSRHRWLSLAVLCFAVGGLRYHIAQPWLGPQHVERWADTEITLVGQVAEEPRRDDLGQQVVLVASQAGPPGQMNLAEGHILVRLPPYPPYYPGDRLMVSGRLTQPKPPQHPTDFDYRAYLARRGIMVLIKHPTSVKKLANPAPAWGLSHISQFREHCRRVVLRLFPEPQAALAIGILLGIQAGLPETARLAFATTGTSHILVVSGWNFSIVAAMLTGLASLIRLRSWPAFWLSLAVMWIYAGFTGASAAVVRAAMMASLALLARTVERQSEPWRLLLAACWLLTLINPQTLWDLGFQLSALATASLFAFGKPMERWLACERWPNHPVTAGPDGNPRCTSVDPATDAVPFRQPLTDSTPCQYSNRTTRAGGDAPERMRIDRWAGLASLRAMAITNRMVTAELDHQRGDDLIPTGMGCAHRTGIPRLAVVDGLCNHRTVLAPTTSRLAASTR